MSELNTFRMIRICPNNPKGPEHGDNFVRYCDVCEFCGEWYYADEDDRNPDKWRERFDGDYGVGYDGD